MAAKVSIRGNRLGRAEVRGQDIGVFATIDGREVLLPCRSLVLHVGGRHEIATATVELEVDEIDLRGIDAEIVKPAVGR